MTVALVTSIWTSIVDNLELHLGLVPDDLPGLDEPLWSGTFLVDGVPREETGMSLRQLLAHTVVSATEVPLALVGGQGFEPVKAVSAQLAGAAPSALLAALRERRGRLFEYLAGLDDEAAARIIPTPLGDFPIAGVLGHSALHAMHHKGQVFCAMRLRGVRTGRFA